MAAKRKRFKDLGEVFYGFEPEFKPSLVPHSNIEIISALSYYNVQLSQDDAKLELIKYAKQFYNEDIIKQLEKLKWVCNVGALCRMQSRGCVFGDESIIHNKILKLLSDQLDKGESVVIINNIKKPKPPKPDNVMYYGNIILNYIEDQALARTFIKPSNLEKYLNNNKVPVRCYKDISVYISKFMKEVSSAYENKDAQITEGYSSYGKKELRLYVELYNFFVDGLLNLVPKNEKKPRKKKPIDMDKKLSKVKYCEIHEQYTSINPKEILGKSVAVIYNIRYKTLSILVSDEKFDIRGSTIYNLNDTKCMKKILRKPEQVLKYVLTNSNINDTIKMLENLTTKLTSPVGSLNENTLILKVW
jgi:hypothetical protein